MFFPNFIKNIKATDRVLEIGPGGTPHPRSNVLLEKKFSSPGEAREQRGNVPELITGKELVYYEGDTFPFLDNEFDYTICSHVLEHVDDVEQFVSEIFRISSKGYFEYPMIYYEYLYNFNVHVNFIKFKNNTLYYLKKSDTDIQQFKPVQNLLLQSLDKGYTKLVDDLKHIMFEGFEWSNTFHIDKADSISELVLEDVDLPVFDAMPQIRTKKVDSSLLGKLSYYLSNGKR